MAARLGEPIAILQDLQGPKIRVGKVENDAIMLKDGEQTVITIEDVIGNKCQFSSRYLSIVNDVSVGDSILLDDGKIVLSCEGKDATQLFCKIEQGGVLKSNKGINFTSIGDFCRKLDRKRY